MIHAPGCALPETNINQGEERITKFYIIIMVFFKESERFHDFPVVTMPHQREQWTNQVCYAVVIDTKDSTSAY